jgi:hypothetical protein
LTFNNAIAGATTYNFDSDADGINDVVFSTTDPSGFNTAGPGVNMSYIQEPGLEGSTLSPDLKGFLSPDLKVNFLYGAVNTLGFGYAMSTLTTDANTSVTFSAFDASNNLLASIISQAAFTMPNGVNPSNFPEGLVSLNFSGVASYALFDFNPFNAPRYIIDNFQGTFGSIERNVPEPEVLALLGAWALFFYGRRIIQLI